MRYIASSVSLGRDVPVGLVARNVAPTPVFCDRGSRSRLRVVSNPRSSRELGRMSKAIRRTSSSVPDVTPRSSLLCRMASSTVVADSMTRRPSSNDVSSWPTRSCCTATWEALRRDDEQLTQAQLTERPRAPTHGTSVCPGPGPICRHSGGIVRFLATTRTPGYGQPTLTGGGRQGRGAQPVVVMVTKTGACRRQECWLHASGCRRWRR
jgi:hypothetical protein